MLRHARAPAALVWQSPWYLQPGMAPSETSDLYRLDITLPPGEAARRVAIAETAHMLPYVADARLTVATRVHELRKYTKRLRALLRLIRTGFPHFKAANASFRDIARLVSSHRDARVMAGLTESLARAPASDPVCAWFEYKATLAEKLAADKFPDILARLEHALIEIDGWQFGDVGRDDVLAGFRKTFGTVLERSDLVSDESESEEAHEWRKCCKDHWYHLRLLHDALPRTERNKIDDYDRLGDLLGSVHDRDVLMHHLETMPAFLAETRNAAAIARAAKRERRNLQTEAVKLAGWLLDDGAKQLAGKIRRKWRV